MAKGKKGSGIKNRASKLSTMKKHPPKEMNTLKAQIPKAPKVTAVKAHPSHPGMEAVRARGPKHGHEGNVEGPGMMHLKNALKKRAAKKAV